MRLLDRYLLKNYVRIFALALAAFGGIYLLVEFFEKVDDFLEHKAAINLYLAYFFWKIPIILKDITPLAVLLATFLTLGGLSRHGELTAMRACGIGLVRISRPLVLAALTVSLLLLVGGDLVTPLAAHKTEYIMRTEVSGQPPLAMKRDSLWFREGRNIIFIRLAEPKKNQLQGVTIYEMDQNFHLRRRLDAKKAYYDASAGWILEYVKIHDFSGERNLKNFSAKKLLPYPLQKKPENFNAAVRRNDEARLQDLYRQVRQLEAEGYDATRARVDLQARIATPFTCLVMAFLGIPFALQRGRASNLALGIGISIAIGISYFLLQATLLAFGYAGALPPWLAAWSGNLLVGMLGTWMLLNTRQ
ncbi:LPS export ABC transporter permease LptG [Geothermobacter hydrogeniphilus]|uniref:LPS export ABC transporter permease LptG n=1 Tax=Geothermobacter hydrogeniphilus TaxID=1969733 RepID=A0A1X0Y2Z9_9BACT|nr:LPS export ABC transporter permease LptG [Geothermobacter hydrogeniphilus]ORJ59533.1 LPS export ABC transporter permease LptG [Geothermobacter hydrogeniphilus]